MDSVNFVTCHDGFTLYDLVAYDRKHNEANGHGNHDGAATNRSWNCGWEGDVDVPDEVRELRHRQLRNAWCLLAMAHGVPMVAMGDEAGRTQGGNNNAYNQDNETSWFDWERAAAFADLERFVGQLLALRAPPSGPRPSRRGGATPCSSSAPSAAADLGPHSRSLAWSVGDLYVIANAWWEPLGVPRSSDPGRWRRVVDTSLLAARRHRRRRRRRPRRSVLRRRPALGRHPHPPLSARSSECFVPTEGLLRGGPAADTPAARAARGSPDGRRLHPRPPRVGAAQPHLAHGGELRRLPARVACAPGSTCSTSGAGRARSRIDLAGRVAPGRVLGVDASAEVIEQAGRPATSGSSSPSPTPTTSSCPTARSTSSTPTRCCSTSPTRWRRWPSGAGCCDPAACSPSATATTPGSSGRRPSPVSIGGWRCTTSSRPATAPRPTPGASCRRGCAGRRLRRPHGRQLDVDVRRSR